jgi:hypothetical protein
MDKELAEYEEIAKKYFNLEVADRTPDSLCELLRVAVETVRANLEENDLFENINLSIQGAVTLPKTNEKYNYLEKVREELLGWEDVEAVINHPGASNVEPGSSIKEEAVKVRLDWCNYINEVIAALSE